MITNNYYVSRPIALFTSAAAMYDKLALLTNVAGSKIPISASSGSPSFSLDLTLRTSHLKKAKGSLTNASSATSASTTCGVCFGNGTAPESRDDYTMSGELLVSYNYTQNEVVSRDDTGVTASITYTITNNEAEDFTISEVGIFGCAGFLVPGYSAKFYCYNILLERTLLETPITIPAGGIGQVTHTIRYDYPAA